MAEDSQPAMVEEQVKGKVGWSIKNPSPLWATYTFRIQFFANKALMLYLAGTDTITPENIKHYLLILASIDLFVWGFAKSIGIKPPESND